MKKYYINGQTNESGALSFEQLKANGLKATDFVWFEGLDAWKPVSEIEELIPLIKKAVVPPPFQPKPTPPPFEPKSTPPPFQKESATMAIPPPFQNPSNTQNSGATLPSNIRFGYQLARKRERFFGELLNGLLTLIPVGLIYQFFSDPENFLSENYSITTTEELLTYIVLPAIFGAIFYPMWSGHIGHRILGLKVISEKDGSDIKKAGMGALREAVKNLSAIALVPLFWLLWDKNKQNLYDKIVETYVVKNK